MTPSRVIGPEWLDANRIYMAGRAPAAVPGSQFAPMFQVFLKQRFHLEIHCPFTTSVAAPPGGVISAAAPPDIFIAIQEQMGLNLEAGRDKVEVIAVDHMDRMPTDN